MTTVPAGSKRGSPPSPLAKVTANAAAPLSAMIEIADRCNEVCVHCYQIQGQKGEMSTEQLLGVIDEMADMGVLFLTISGGEATLRRDFLQIVEHARRRRFAVTLFTNGLNMTRELARRLAELAVQRVEISLYSHRAEVHDWVTRVPGSFDRTVQGIRHLVEEGVTVRVKASLMRVNVGEYDKFIGFVRGLGADYSVNPGLKAREDGDRTPEQLQISDADRLRVQRDHQLVDSRKHAAADKEKRLSANPCGACSGSLHVEANGEIRPCTMLAVPTGDAPGEGVRTAWYENENARLIRNLTWQDLHGCRDCDLRGYCERCYASAQHQGGDALGPYEGACHAAKLKYQLVHGAAPRIVEAVGGRSATLGPYRERADGSFETAPDVRTEHDDELVRRYPWLRAERDAAPEQPAEPGQLVQIRRPGKRPRDERVPDASAPAPTASGR